MGNKSQIHFLVLKRLGLHGSKEKERKKRKKKEKEKKSKDQGMFVLELSVFWILKLWYGELMLL